MPLDFHGQTRTLVLCFPTSYHHEVMQLILQFPNLQPSLIFEFFKPGEWAWPMALSGHLRCVGLGPMTLLLPEELLSDLPGGMNFRPVGLQDVHCGLAQQTLDRCAGSLETFTCGTVKRVREEPTHIVTPANPTGSFL